MNKQAIIIGVIGILLFGMAIIGPGPVEAQFCSDQIACATVYSLGPVSNLVLCQFLHPTLETARGHVDYVFCQSSGDSKMWNCDRQMPRGLSPVTVTESEWANEATRCAKVCGGCPSGWKSASMP